MLDDAGGIAATHQSNAKWAGLKSWTLFEQFMTDLDNGMVNDYNDDINTLLTFAGLFSAVLTAFLIESYKWLQPDSSTTTNQTLGQISQQIANSSISPVNPQAAPDFQATTSSVSVNTLWFLALVLSLAAALFGMMAKQWLRQYLRWTTMSGPSEDQVLLRQMRHEAFHDWQMPAIIASIPALLEIALILFLVGMDILLWTLNGVVFGVCTGAIAVLICLAFVTTVLPVFCPRCPYKSPAGWAFLLACQVAPRLWNRTMHPLQYLLRSLGHWGFRAYNHYIDITDWKDWRQRDLELRMSNVASPGSTPRVVYTLAGNNVAGSVVHDAAGRVQALLRTLGWICSTSQDVRLLREVERSITIHNITRDWHPLSRLVFNFHAACTALNLNPQSLVPNEERCVASDNGTALTAIHHIFNGLVHYKLLGYGGRWQDLHLPFYSGSFMAPSLRVQLAHMIASDLAAVLDAKEDFIKRGTEMYGKQAAYYLQASALLGAYLALTVVVEEHRASIATDSFAALLERLLSDIERVPSSSSFWPVLVPVFQLMRECEDRLDRRLFLVSAGKLRLVNLALHFPPNDPAQWSRADCGFFVRISQDALWKWETPHESAEMLAILPGLLDRMAACAERSLPLDIRCCGVFQLDFHWVTRLSLLFDPGDSDFMGKHIPQTLFPHHLVNALSRLNNAGLIYSEESDYSITALLRRSLELQSSPRNTADENEQLKTGTQELSYNIPLPMSSSPSICSIRNPLVDAPIVHPVMALPEVLHLNEMESFEAVPVVSLNPEQTWETGMELMTADGSIGANGGHLQPSRPLLRAQFTSPRPLRPAPLDLPSPAPRMHRAHKTSNADEFGLTEPGFHDTKLAGESKAFTPEVSAPLDALLNPSADRLFSEGSTDAFVLLVEPNVSQKS